MTDSNVWGSNLLHQATCLYLSLMIANLLNVHNPLETGFLHITLVRPTLPARAYCIPIVDKSAMTIARKIPLTYEPGLVT